MKEGTTMTRARKVKEISFTMPNKVGLLSEVTTAVAGAKVNITAICAYAMENSAHFMLTVDSNAKAKKALALLGVGIEERDVVEVEMPNKSGELQKVAKKIADAGINIEYIYGTAEAGKMAPCVLKTSDDQKMIKIINK
jgi:hypothetical protein